MQVQITTLPLIAFEFYVFIGTEDETSEPEEKSSPEDSDDPSNSSDEEYETADETLENEGNHETCEEASNIEDPQETKESSFSDSKPSKNRASKKKRKWQRQRLKLMTEVHFPFAECEDVNPDYLVLNEVNTARSEVEFVNKVPTLMELCLQACHSNRVPPGLRPTLMEFHSLRKLESVQLSWLYHMLSYYTSFHENCPVTGHSWFYFELNWLLKTEVRRRKVKVRKLNGKII